LPEESVVAVRTFSISTGLEASTVTPGSTAPDASLTVPDSVTCAQVTLGMINTHAATQQRFRDQSHLFLISPFRLNGLLWSI
jgi:hypothetical protein